MKRFLQTLVLVAFTSLAFAQQPCQAGFTYYYDGVSLLYLNDASINPADSTPLNITSYVWVVQYGGASYTYNIPNPVIQVPNYPGPIMVCYTIATNLGCTSTICDTVYLFNTPPFLCNADFAYQGGGMLNTYSFTDQSTTSDPLIPVNYWYWAIYDSNQTILDTFNLQNFTFTFTTNGTYAVCLTIGTSNGCTDTQCYTLTVPDSNNQNNCQLNISAALTHVSVIGGNDGAIDLTVTGGVPPYLYQWNTGATTQDISGLTSGNYYVVISHANTCPPITATFEILEPYNISPNDSLFTFPFDTCFNFLVDSFYISNIVVSGNLVYVTWVFMGGGMVGTITVPYTYTNLGTYVVAITINCAKGTTTTYYSYINVATAATVVEVEGTSVVMYPNPFNGSLRVDVPPGYDIMIFNNLGQLIHCDKTSEFTNLIDASGWKSGVYYIRLSNGKHVLTGKAVRQ